MPEPLLSQADRSRLRGSEGPRASRLRWRFGHPRRSLRADRDPLPSMTLPPPPDPARVRKILVRSTNWIGDIVMISPALAALRTRFASARIEVVALPHLAAGFEGNPPVDVVLPFVRRG